MLKFVDEDHVDQDLEEIAPLDQSERETLNTTVEMLSDSRSFRRYDYLHDRNITTHVIFCYSDMDDRDDALQTFKHILKADSQVTPKRLNRTNKFFLGQISQQLVDRFEYEFCYLNLVYESTPQIDARESSTSSTVPITGAGSTFHFRCQTIDAGGYRLVWNARRAGQHKSGPRKHPFAARLVCETCS